jgi:hypothetical protein
MKNSDKNFGVHVVLFAAFILFSLFGYGCDRTGTISRREASDTAITFMINLGFEHENLSIKSIESVIPYDSHKKEFWYIKIEHRPHRSVEVHIDRITGRVIHFQATDRFDNEDPESVRPGPQLATRLADALHLSELGYLDSFEITECNKTRFLKFTPYGRYEVCVGSLEVYKTEDYDGLWVLVWEEIELNTTTVIMTDEETAIKRATELEHKGSTQVLKAFLRQVPKSSYSVNQNPWVIVWEVVFMDGEVVCIDAETNGLFMP